LLLTIRPSDLPTGQVGPRVLVSDGSGLARLVGFSFWCTQVFKYLKDHKDHVRPVSVDKGFKLIEYRDLDDGKPGARPFC
jgi:hypothetical protein